MEKTISKPNQKQQQFFNRFMYGGFLVLGIVVALIGKDLSTAVSNFGIALIFDPFDVNVSWNKRPMYQKAWLVIHLLIVFAGFGWLIWNK
ncbi:MAG: hypothetical protein ACOYKE_12565 [Ferruginibacter sp.]